MRRSRNFKGVEHRIEFVAEIDGVKFYNDSKATSVDATSKALEALSGGEGKTMLILGGRGKNAPYAPLIELIETSVRALVLIGEDARQYRIAVARTRRDDSCGFDGGCGQRKVLQSRERGRCGAYSLRRVRALICSRVLRNGEKFLRRRFSDLSESKGELSRMLTNLQI